MPGRPDHRFATPSRSRNGRYDVPACSAAGGPGPGSSDRPFFQERLGIVQGAKRPRRGPAWCRGKMNGSTPGDGGGNAASTAARFSAKSCWQARNTRSAPDSSCSAHARITRSRRSRRGLPFRKAERLRRYRSRTSRASSSGTDHSGSASPCSCSQSSLVSIHASSAVKRRARTRRVVNTSRPVRSILPPCSPCSSSSSSNARHSSNGMARASVSQSVSVR